MPVLMVGSKIKPEHAADAEAAINRVFSAIEQAQPAGVRYASTRLAAGVSFVVLLELEDRGRHPPCGTARGRGGSGEPQAVDGPAADRGAADRRRVVPVVRSV
jgi:hypothetical protein